nr:protein FAR1-RELATED SEQUENCE 5-like [Ipomoea batatas]
MEATEPTQLNSSMDDEERWVSEHAFGPANINIENTLAAKLWKEFYTCMALSKGNKTEMQQMLDLIQDHKGNMLKNRG